MLAPLLSDVSFILLLILAFALGVWVCDITGKALGVADYGGIVWDEIVSFMLVLFFTPPGWYLVVAGLRAVPLLRHRQASTDTLFRQQLAWRAGRDVRRPACCRLCIDVPCIGQKCADMNRAVTALFCAVLLCLNGPAFGDALGPDSGQEFSARVIAVLDGDTVLILHKAAGQYAGGLMKIRLAEIDAPEKGSGFRHSLAQLAGGNGMAQAGLGAPAGEWTNTGAPSRSWK